MAESNEMTRLMDSLGRKENTPAEIYANIRNKALDEALEEFGKPEGKWCENTADSIHDIYDRIRALKTKDAE